MCKASYTYGTLYCTPFRYSYGCFGFRFDFLCCYTQRKQPQLSTSKRPQQFHIDRPHFSGACCAALLPASDRQELLWRRGDLGFSLKNTTVSSADYTATGKLHREDNPLPHLQLKDAVLHDWNCQIKHTVGEVSKQVFTKEWQNISNGNDWQGVYREISSPLDVLEAFVGVAC